ncbi:diguanylate cyclase domain-containing protein [Pseudomonas sp. M47T1]|uniref:sensor domain-containing diguanylate cyclase n=1 Tax=unclassified Pseudomonas TaxID=196821 RepID=UPI0002607F77|nr:sensor domain-containing diguanylate cyclase [Pseudomonas sp. M47T1]EIK98162.1 diguanylate cyclase domain-containing protein [Pseudomonas sp. M47T1]
MPPRFTSLSQRSLILTLVLLLASGFVLTSLLSYYASRSSIRDNIVNTELPLTSDTVYSEIQKDLVRPVLISSMMSRDTFMRDWVMAGERDPQQMTRYLQEVMSHYGAYTAFFVSDASLTYYQAKGVLKKVKAQEPRDAWYFRVRDMQTPYEINVDVDMANHDALTIFINYKVFDYQDRFIGAAGVGLTVNAVVKLIEDYEQRYQRDVYFVDRDGRVVLTGAQGGPLGAHSGQQLNALADLHDLLARMPKPATGSYEYAAQGKKHYLNVRFIPELDWYLFVDKREDNALGDIRQSLYLNLLICLLVTALVLGLLKRVVNRYQLRLERLATRDMLTDLPNRRGFDLLASQAISEAERDPQPLAALLLDLDHFKQLNDSHGHLAGDEVLKGFAQVLRDSLRQSDILCRWGGEEFIVLLRNTPGGDALQIAEKIRRHAEEYTFPYAGKSLKITTSVGVTGLQANDSLHSLLNRADHALYRAKQSGRNCVRSELPQSHYE